MSDRYISKYIDNVSEIIKQSHPDVDETVLRDKLNDIVKRKIQDLPVELDNNYTEEHRSSTLLSVLDWANKNKPIIAGNGTFYKQHDESYNPIIDVLRSFKSKRKEYKNKMFDVGDATSREYKMYDNLQMNEKINNNSYYGASGLPSCSLYSKWSGPATTNTARQVISTTEQMFEAFLADNFQFLNITETVEWIMYNLNNIKKDKLGMKLKSHDINEVVDRIYSKIINRNDDDRKIIFNLLRNCSDEEINKLFYINNLILFIDDHEDIKDLIIEIYDNIENLDYGDEDTWRNSVPSLYEEKFADKTYEDWKSFVNIRYFMNPNNVPDTIDVHIKKLSDYIFNYVYTSYVPVDRVYRLQNFKRKVVTVIDTDSNILSMDTIVEYIFGNVICGNSFGRDRKHNEYIIINIMAYIITNAVTNSLLLYGKYSNVKEDIRPVYNMKNEFYFSSLYIAVGKNAKKKYMSRIELREGNLMDPPKYDIKGFDFKKATTAKETEEVFMDIIKNDILSAEFVDSSVVYNRLEKFRKCIIDDIYSGSTKFLPIVNTKEIGAYKDPYREESVKSVLIWNMINPEKMIEPPLKVKSLKLKIFDEKDLESIKDRYPDIYKTLIDNVFNDTDGIFRKQKQEYGVYYAREDANGNILDDWYEYIPTKYRSTYKKKGADKWNKFVEELGNEVYDDKYRAHIEYGNACIKSIAIPRGSEIPEWAKEFIDIDTIVNNILSPFNPVAKMLKLAILDEGKSYSKVGVDRKSKRISNIIRF